MTATAPKVRIAANRPKTSGRQIVFRALGGVVMVFVTLAGAEAAPNVAELPPVSIESGASGEALASTATTEPSAVAAETEAPKPVARHVSRLHVQTIDTSSLTVPAIENGGARLHARMPMVIEARATTMRPAPLPDQDIDAPGPDAQTLASQREASVSPSFYANKDHFSGDGFSAGSNLENDKNNRRRPGGGMSLSIPVQ